MPDWEEVVEALKAPILHGGGRHYIHAMYHADWDSFPWYLYAHSYKSAADYLVSNQEHIDKNAHYAIMFLYRHSLELKIKEHIFRIDEYLDKDEPGNFKEHRLGVLYDEYRNGLGEVIDIFGLDRDEILEHDSSVADRIAEFDRLDQSSADLRYPVTKRRTSSMENILQNDSAAVVDLVQIALAVDAVSTWIDATGDVLEEAHTLSS